MLRKLVEKEQLEIVISWCNCMVGTYQSCSHVIDLLYKTDYALQKGFLKAFCTSKSCSRNKSTKCDIKRKKIKDIVIQKKIRLMSNNEELDIKKKE